MNLDGEGVLVKEFPSMIPVARLLAPKHVTAIEIIDTNQGLHALVAAGSSGIMCLFNIEEITEEEIEPVLVAPIVTKTSSGVKGGIGQIILSSDQEIFIACGVHSKGLDIRQRNYVTATNDLSVLGTYDLERGDTSQFSSEDKYTYFIFRRKNKWSGFSMH